MKQSKVQPASTNYFFGQSYIDLGKIISCAWRNNGDKASEYGGKISASFSAHGFWGLFPAIYYIIATISMYVFGTIICGVISLVHVVVLLIFNMMVYIFTGIIRMFEQIYISIHKIFGACPYCKNHYKIPVYVCDCGAEHTYLVPGKYGIIKRKCNCGKKLPTSVLTGRNKLRAKCPECGHILDNSLGIQEAVPVCIPVIGGPSVGKTCYITAVMKELVEKVAPKTETTLRFYNQNNEITCKNMINLYNSGVIQQKTSDLNPAAYNFFLQNKKGGVQRLVYFYDIAGEAFTTANALTTQRQYEYAHGFIFIIDPLSIPRIKAKHYNTPEFSKHAASVADINETFGSFMGNLSRISGMSANELSKIPCAVVINKIDAFGLSDIVGAKAIRTLQTKEEYANIPFDKLMDTQIREFLNANGMTNFVKNVDMGFKNSQFFAVSSLGHTPDGTTFDGDMTLAPFEWIASKVDGNLRNLFKKYHSK